MKIQGVPVPSANQFVQQYIENTYDIKKYFHYNIHEEQSVIDRYNEIKNRPFPRQELSDYLQLFLEKFQPDEKTKANVLALADKDTFVVVGGQQAGLLTGPLYTIHKIISIIQLARKYEEQLGKKVVPVFWVAGEDHDIEEVNYTSILKNGRIKKQRLYSGGKKSTVSETPLDQAQCRKHLDDIIKTYGETAHTKEISQFLNDRLSKSETYVDFFIHLVLHLFKDTGLVVMDSGDEGLRKVEAPFFQQLVKNHESIMTAFENQQTFIENNGFTPQIQVKENCIHLFYLIDGERHLLEKNQQGNFITKDGKISFSYNEMLKIAEETPEKLSNNVVTRPIMEEYLLPNLAFVAGLGEVAYWGELKQVFEMSGMSMPPVIPRQMITIVERHIARNMSDVKLDVGQVLTGSIRDYEHLWLTEKTKYPVADQFSQAQANIKAIHENLRNLAEKVDSNLTELALKNEGKILEQVQFLEQRISLAIREQNQVDLEKFARIGNSLRPENSFQERVWNVFYYVNKYGFDFVKELTELPFEWDLQHKVVEL